MTEESEDLTGEVIGGRWTAERLIAQGGFSSVYRAIGTDGTRVAVKVLWIRRGEQISMERFRRESAIVQDLQSPNTVRVFDSGIVEDRYLYTVMEYIAGRSLYRQVRKYGALKPRQVAEIALQVCDSLIEVHAKGFLHRDLKPSNVMMFRNDDGRVIVKVLDFGVAKVMGDQLESDRLTIQGSFVGTPRYASPEQLRRETLTPAADVYAVGLLMWECLVGEPAVPTRELADAIQFHIGPEPWRLPETLECPDEMRDILEKSLAKPLDRRYQSCVELKAALSGWLTSRYGVSRPDPLEGTQLDTAERPALTKKEPYHPETVEDLEAEDELFGEVIEKSDGYDDAVEVMESHDLSESSAARASRLQIAKRNSDHAGISAEDRPIATAPKSSGSNVGITIAVLVVALLAGVYLFSSAGGDPAPDAAATPDATEEQAAAAPTPAAEKKEPAAPVQPDAERGDGSPTLPADTLIKGMVASGWRIGKRETTKMDEVLQTSVLAEKEGSATSVVIYESDTWKWADEFKLGTEPPAQAVSFGRTVIRLSSGPSNKSNGVASMKGDLEAFKQQAMERRDGAPKPDEAPPTAANE